eukprot:comp23813_c0_seq1/m.59367 comp23813_c0_seq1/g.59367  ORF comp23813_c0_seq1/g.59367 comp23813_c0_seq1/m.59367 type:complete len:163 (-) comp23813_c0_seq1:61-549(-)
MVFGGLFDGLHLLRKDGSEVDAVSHLSGKRVLLFFSASWCGDCVEFLPSFAEFYDSVQEEANLEVVLVPSDATRAEELEYMKKHPDWVAISADSPAVAQLKRKFEICARKEMEGLGMSDRRGGIPSVVALNAEGKAISDKCVDDINKKGEKAVTLWFPEVKL